jgi:hypothetical protein
MRGWRVEGCRGLSTARRLCGAVRFAQDDNFRDTSLPWWFVILPWQDAELASGSTADDDRRTAGQSERDDQEQNKYSTRSHGDSLEKTEKEQVQTH